MPVRTIQLGKQGITENFINGVRARFNDIKTLQISVLASARGSGKEGKEKVREYSEHILRELGNHFTAKIVGFTIILKKWRQARE